MRLRSTARPEPPPPHRMCRAAKPVEASSANGPWDSPWGSRWRPGRQDELQWYSSRLEVIKEIRSVAKARGRSEEAAVHMVNMQQQQTGCSLDLLCGRLRVIRGG